MPGIPLVERGHVYALQNGRRSKAPPRRRKRGHESLEGRRVGDGAEVVRLPFGLEGNDRGRVGRDDLLDAEHASDIDGMGHVNNAIFSAYLEQARLAWFGRYAEDEPMPLRDVILARTEIDFRSTYVGGTEALVRAVLEAPGLDAIRVSVTDRVTD